MHSPWETHPDGQDQLSLQLRGSALQPLMGYLSPQTTVNNSSTYKEPMTWIFLATPNAPKSHIMQEMQGRMLTRYNLWNEDR